MLATICKRFAALSRSGWSRTLAGPTGERNVYTLVPREAVLCIAGNDDDRLTQLAAVLAAGSRPIWPAGVQAEALMATLPDEVARSIALAQDWTAETVVFDAVLHHGSTEDLQQVLRAVAARPGPIVSVRSLKPGETDVSLESLVIERALSVNTAAAGGNASLMTIG
jgi:RHH-type proline utilization regulon transcriptional repressor/proline dehydrogenase/delta 1-pyrroline-5-carboxylate dehydrogenase